MQSERWRSCTDLFHAAIERPPNERDAFLDETCEGDEALRRRVELLLKYHEESGDFIESPAFEAVPELLLDDADALIGQHLGHYRIESVLGVGGIGVVYLAQDERLGRKVGLKLLPQSLVADEAQLERLKREARTASALNHPNIVTVYEIAEVDGVHYLATEFIEGTTLRERMMRGPIPPDEALEIALQIASALSVAHAAGIIHRDIKPENIMLRPDGYVKVLDFGIAKFTPQSVGAAKNAADMNATRPGMILGTARYMSPEQARGKPVDAQSDLWSLGVVLYEMLAGGPPFDGETPTDVMAAVLRSDPPALDHFAPADVRRIIAKTLTKDKETRYQNATDLRRDLENARDKSDSRVSHRWRNAAVAALVILALSSLWFWQWPNDSPWTGKKSIAVLPFQNLSPDPNDVYFAQGIQGEILTRLSKISALKVMSRTSTQKYQSAPDNTREIGRQLDVAYLVEGSVQKIANTAKVTVQLIRADRDEHLWAESYSRSLNDIFAVEGEVASAIAQQLDVKLTGAEEKAIANRPTQSPAAYEAYLRGIAIEETQTSAELPMMQAAAEYQEAVRLDPKFALAWARLAILRSFLHSQGLHAAVNSPENAKAAADQARALDPQSGESWLAQGAYLYRVARDYPGALQAFQEALRYLPNNAKALELTAFVERRLGQWEPGLNHLRQALELDPRNVTMLNSMANAFLGPMRRFAECHAMLDRILEIVPNAEGTRANKATLFHREGRLAEAAQQFERVAPDSTEETVLFFRPRHFAYERRFEEAIAQMQTSISLTSKPGAPLAGSRIENLTLLGYYQEWAGRQADARNTFVNVIEELKPAPETVVPVTPKRLPCHLALAYAGLGEKEKALAQARRAVEDYGNDLFDKASAEQTLAQIQARFGDMDAAIAAVSQLLEVPGFLTRGLLRIDPFWDPLRHDPRFKKIVAD